jgi:hypothetical protein
MTCDTCDSREDHATLTTLIEVSNHLITGQWCEPLTSAREITINVNNSQGTLVHSNECEWMSWSRTYVESSD